MYNYKYAHVVYSLVARAIWAFLLVHGTWYL